MSVFALRVHVRATVRLSIGIGMLGAASACNLKTDSEKPIDSQMVPDGPEAVVPTPEVPKPEAPAEPPAPEVKTLPKQEPPKPQPLPGVDETAPVVVDRAPRSTAPRTVPAKPLSAGVIAFTSEPAGATVRLLDKAGNVVASGATPITLTAPVAGSYRWEIEREGFLTDRSAADKPALADATVDTIRIKLTAIGDRAKVLDAAKVAFADKRTCGEAIRLYESLPKPDNMTGQLGNEWLDAQLRITQCSMAIKEYARALDAVEVIKKERPREWLAPYYEGVIACETRSYRKGLSTLSQLTGSYLGSLGTEDRQTVPLLVKYQKARCDELEYNELGQPERNRDLLDRMLTQYEEFMEGADRLKGRGFPKQWAKELQAAYDAAKSSFEKHSK